MGHSVTGFRLPRDVIDLLDGEAARVGKRRTQVLIDLVRRSCGVEEPREMDDRVEELERQLQQLTEDVRYLERKVGTSLQGSD